MSPASPINPTIEEKLAKYFMLTKKALAVVKIKGELTQKEKNQANDLLHLAQCYYEDAQHFEKKKDTVNAFGAVCYAHAFLDVGARLELFDVDDDTLFMVDGK